MTASVFGFPLYSDTSVSYTPAFSGGSWAASLPLANVMDRRLAKVARSTNATTGSTTFDVDLGTARSVGVLALLLPNLTKSSTPTIQWKASASNAFGSLIYDSGALQAWPTGLTAEDSTGMNVWTPTLPASAQTARYWRCQITDTANADGYVDVARVVIAGAYTPSFAASVGAKTSLESDTVRTVTDGGAALYQDKPRRRSDLFSIDNLPQAEVFANVRAMQRRLGTSGQLFFVFDSADTTLMAERSYLAVLRDLSPLEYPVGTFMSAPFSLVEEL